jgi:hypothetical protein
MQPHQEGISHESPRYQAGKIRPWDVLLWNVEALEAGGVRLAPSIRGSSILTNPEPLCKDK